MSNFYLKFSVDGVMLKRIYCPSIVDGTNRFIHAKFEFGDGWGELTKYLFVARNNETYSVLMESDECIIDQHAVNTVGQFDMQVVGVKDDVRAVTNAITIKVKTSEMANNPSGEETRFTSDFIITSLEEIRKLKLDTEDIAKEYSEQAGAYAKLAGDHEEAAKRIVDEMPGQINKAVEDATLAAERFAEESKTSKDHSKQYADESKESADKAESSAVISKASEDTVKQISDELPQRINNYVANHKEELKGYTPIKGVDYFDGTNGRDGVDGKSVTVTSVSDGALVSDEFGHSVLVKNGTNGIDGKDGKDGEVSRAELDEVLAAQSDEIVQIDNRVTTLENKPSGTSTDVQINGTSITENGVANIPIANANRFGVVQLGSGLMISNNKVMVINAGDTDLKNRYSGYAYIRPTNLDSAVRYAMTDGIGKEWTDEEKIEAQKRIGVYKEMQLILNTTLTEAVKYIVLNNLNITRCTVYIGTANAVVDGNPPIYISMKNIKMADASNGYVSGYQSVCSAVNFTQTLKAYRAKLYTEGEILFAQYASQNSEVYLAATNTNILTRNCFLKNGLITDMLIGNVSTSEIAMPIGTVIKVWGC